MTLTPHTRTKTETVVGPGLLPGGERVHLDGEPFYRISGYDRMPPFLMSIAGDSDLWMFITSRGGLTAGRRDADGSLFPYETVDKLFDGHHHTGPITRIRLKRPGGLWVLWRPFSEPVPDGSRIERNLYKNVLGNRVVFEEVHRDLEVAFRYRWSGSDAAGLVRTATLTNLGADGVEVSVLDGLRNVLPFGAPLTLYQRSSSLVDAYKRTDCDPETQMGIFSLTATIVDRPEPAEQLRANVVWCTGLRDFEVCLSSKAVPAFEEGKPVTGDGVLTGRRGNYLVVSSFSLQAGAESKWHLAADVGLSHLQIQELRARLLERSDRSGDIEAALDRAGENLLRLVASADGLQLTGESNTTAHHLANVLFNAMRGGVFWDNHRIPSADLADFVHTRNRPVARRHRELLDSLPGSISASDLIDRAERTGDADFRRICLEYLPLTFGRRHGDPSRPWNHFSIRVKSEDGSRALHYEGNWRDIFQNWEALARSFPGFLPGMVAKFLNASTVDGFNPYRITRDGIEWDVDAPGDPWSNIGYWGDHQIVYLLKLLEALARTSPGTLEGFLDKEIFAFADVPYRIKPYPEILEDPRHTVAFDAARAAKVEERVAAVGTDGKLCPAPDGSVQHANLLEKLLIPALAKLSNLVPEAGIWMNTQRPEWNDANNALVGNGVSMVTLCYLRRYLEFLQQLLAEREDGTLAISSETAEWLRRLEAVFEANRPLLTAGTLDDAERKKILDALGSAFSAYRQAAYDRGLTGRSEIRVSEVTAFLGGVMEILDHAIHVNRREDGLFHAYNLIAFPRNLNRVSVQHLYEMLEGQVAVLSSGVLSAAESAELLATLFRSRLYRSDRKSFLLYPERELPAFLDRNVIPEDSVRLVPLLRELIEAGEDSVAARDALGVYRFHGNFQNAADVAAALDTLAEQDRWREAVERDRQAVLDVFEEVFEHRSFTGRSGTMYGYEGLGCIYWHMVSKLLLAVQETFFRSVREGEPAAVRRELAEAYYRIRAGLGFERTAREYGAFPTDPYSHTPAHGGARQPGMTGQVKEEILTRFGELGVEVNEGRIRFRPLLLRREEFLGEPGSFRFYDVNGTVSEIAVPAGGLAFTFCQVPVVYRLVNGEPSVRVVTSDGSASERPGQSLDERTSRLVLQRQGDIVRIEVGVAAPASQ